MKGFHSTIQAKLEKILAAGALEPGKESIEDDSYIYEWMILGVYRESSPRHCYFWNSFPEAENCARFSSSKAKREYRGERARPVVIEVDIKDESRISPDPHSKGFRYLGSIPKEYFVHITHV